MGRLQIVRSTILITDAGKVPAKARAILAACGKVESTDGTRNSLLQNIVHADVLFTLLGDTIDAEVLERAERLKLVATPTTGLNHIDVEYAEQKGITVVSLRGEVEFLRNITATAELTWTLLLALKRRLVPAFASVKRAEWDRNQFVGNELTGKTLGIIGYGRLGRIVAGYGQAFRMNVMACDTVSFTPPDGITRTSIDNLLAASDVVSLHIPCNNDTVGFFGASHFAKMKAGAVFLNTSRGEVVDEAALVHALESGRLSGAGVDVLSGETSLDSSWLTRHPLLRYLESHDNLIITPHVGGATFESMEATSCFVAEKIMRHLNG
jgi:D-3-phosphoglycerate dehydrogenase